MIDEKHPRYIATVKLSTGETITLTMPTIGEVYLPLLNREKPWIEVIIPAATKQSWEWFTNLSLLDGTIILIKLAPAFKAMNETIKAMDHQGTKH